MRRLTLVRHAKAEHAARDQLDFDRRLSDRGERDAAELAARTHAALPAPTLIVTSPAARALATARAFADVAGYAPERIVYEARIYEAPASRLLELVRSHGGRAAHVMLFGHNPGISDFASRLLADGGPLDLPTCAVVSLTLPGADWAALDWHAATLDHSDTP